MMSCMSLCLPFLRTTGQTVYSLCVGEPDYQPPAEVITATVRTCTQIHMQTYTCIHTYTDTYTYTCRHEYAFSYTHHIASHQIS